MFIERSSIKKYFLGIKFLSGYVVSPNTNLISVREEQFIDSESGRSYRVKILHPKSKINTKLPGVLLLHGMNKQGIDDSRILHLANIITSMGYTTILPEIPEVTELQINESTLDSVYNAICSVVERNDLFLDKRLGFFSVSFCGGIGLITLSKPKLKDKISAIVTIGAYSHFGSTIPFVMDNYEEDNYGTCIFFHNYIDFFDKSAKNLKIYFYEAAMDNGLKRTGESAIAPKVFLTLNEKELELYRRIHEDKEFRKNLFEEFRLNSKSLIDHLSPINYLEKIRSSISLVHGKGDLVIPEIESQELAKELDKLKKPYKLEITRLLSHGDTLPIWKQIPGIPGLASAFGYFFTNI